MNPPNLLQQGIDDLEVVFVAFGRKKQCVAREVSRNNVGLLRAGRGVEH